MTAIAPVSFLTPYLAGRDMMRLHLQSIRRFHPEAPILVSKKGGGREEMESLRSEFGVRYWIEECGYEAAFRRLMQRCDTRYACVTDHDTILLSPVDPLLRGLEEGRYELVGIEERIRVPDRIWTQHWPESGGWLRFAPGYTDATFLLFDIENFMYRWGLDGLASPVLPRPGWSWEAHYGLCEKLSRHHYLRPYHAPKYGMGNLLKDGENPILWHAWYGSHSARTVGAGPGDLRGFEPCDSVVRVLVESAERAFLADFPDLDLAGCAPAWWPGCDLEAEMRELAGRAAALEARGGAIRHAWAGFLSRLARMKGEGVRGTMARIAARAHRH